MFGLARERSDPRSPAAAFTETSISETTMMSVSHASNACALALVLASVSWSAGAARRAAVRARSITSAVINHPITTSSAEARCTFSKACEFDLAASSTQTCHFRPRVAADPDSGSPT